MGAQLAALLSGPPPYGQVPDAGPVTGQLELARPAGFGLDATARSGAAVALPPTGFDGQRLWRRLPGGPVSVTADRHCLQVTVHGQVPQAAAALTRMLGLTDDLRGLYAGCREVPSLAWVPEVGAGRVLRAPTVWEDLVGLLASTRTSLRATRSCLQRLVGGGPFPDPEAVARRGEQGLRALGFGYRSPWLAQLAEAVAGGRLDPQAWAALADEEVTARVRALPGLGPFSAASLLPLLGRPRPLLLDGWLGRWFATRLPGVDLSARYAPLGRWAGTGAWLEVSADWLAPADAERPAIRC